MREARLNDIPRLLEWGRKFHEASKAPFGFNDEAVALFLADLMERGAVIMSDTGMIGGVLSPAYCDPEWIMAVEMFWWAERDGLALLKAFEDWAAENGASEVRMTSLAALPRADAILQRKGYEAMEISYQKVV